MVSGSVLSVWSRVEGVLASKMGTHNNKMQVIRLRIDDGQKIVGKFVLNSVQVSVVYLFSFKIGTLIPKACVDSLIEALSSDAEKTEEKTF